MGLDMYAYVASRAGEQNDFYEGAQLDKESKEYVHPTLTKPRELAYWRKHPNLHGWMEKLWTHKIRQRGLEPEKSDFGSSFNGIELELTWEDLDQLEQDIRQGSMAKMNTRGFFFGDPSDDYYKEADLKFIRDAKAELVLGLKVFYNSSW